MPTLSQNLVIDRCPHCSVANPNLSAKQQLDTRDHMGANYRVWNVYACERCGGVVTAASFADRGEVVEIYPLPKSIKEDIPERPRSFLQQAIDSLHAPSGAVMLAASAVDSMLKLKGYAKGSLYDRIEKTVKDHVITQDMATWAHEVRLDANDQRHADEEASLPSQADAERVVDFAMALAEILFVLPSRVQRGITQA
ncbi:DUF4145 domain-containing protein [Hydrogenovibrio thermophilus]|uniref:DUF4145 domain-containing protein n=1 Tax=Hydrogenovibrio thermophilus TaxID=265883 RepID=A0A410H4H7_9GAMM|nr:DUF4145 domain-containing protein [Hydrogenovibrio thermophilus]QAB15838.1 DUF4145 domain-containing protein [Hydrogenovibrio thermophilus]